MGKLVVIEGIDGVGKSTQYHLLLDRLTKEEKEKVVTHHFPSYGTYQARAVEEYLKGNYGKITELSPYFVNSLYATDRAITWLLGLKAEYEKDNFIILDRYTTSSIIYQSAEIDNIKEKEEFIDYVTDYEYNKLGIPNPDLVIFLYAPFEVVNKLKAKRINNDGIKNDIHERDLEFLRKVSDNAYQIAQKLGWNIIYCNQEDNMRSIESIHEEVYKLVRKIK